MSDIARILVDRGASAEIDRRICLDWYDGPLKGFIWLRQPTSAWYFTLWAAAWRSDDVDDRLYALAALPDDGERIIENALAPLNPPSDERYWTVDPRCASEEQNMAASAALDALIERLEAPSVLLRSSYLDDIEAAWLVVRPPH
jgi:hypothetical protein